MISSGSYVVNTPLKQEETFQSRPSIRLTVPDHLKSILVDDWENVTRNLQLITLPTKPTVNELLDDYLAYEQAETAAGRGRPPGSAAADILEEVIAGLREYFDMALGRVLLYRFERDQFFEVSKWWEGGSAQRENIEGPSDVYGAEHLCRLFGQSSPQLFMVFPVHHCLLTRSYIPRNLLLPFLSSPLSPPVHIFSTVSNLVGDQLTPELPFTRLLCIL